MVADASWTSSSVRRDRPCRQTVHRTEADEESRRFHCETQEVPAADWLIDGAVQQAAFCAAMDTAESTRKRAHSLNLWRSRSWRVQTPVRLRFKGMLDEGVLPSNKPTLWPVSGWVAGRAAVR